ncbi:MAG TPA: hypothetical protein VN285_07525, partial [Candidatus Deferrimicrobium sp.]|nr:hypothetical protein [Candidatus Deferrimicrobium sp.]
MRNLNCHSESGTGAKLLTDSRAISNYILERANSGIPRTQFLKEVSQLLLEYSGCDTVRLVLRDSGRYYRCELGRGLDSPFAVDVTPNHRDHDTAILWSSGENDRLEHLCRDIIDKRVNSSQPGFTEYGSFWTGSVRSLRGSDLDISGIYARSGIKLGENIGSLALIPIEAGHERSGLMQLESRRENLFSPEQIDNFEDLMRTFGI